MYAIRSYYASAPVTLTVTPPMWTVPHQVSHIWEDLIRHSYDKEPGQIKAEISPCIENGL